MKSSGLTLYILFDATTSADGNTYDRPSIEGWFQLGNITSPLTGLELATEMIFPNISQLNTPNYPEMNNLPKSLPPRHLTKLPRLASPRLRRSSSSEGDHGLARAGGGSAHQEEQGCSFG